MIEIKINPPDAWSRLIRQLNPAKVKAAARKGMQRAVLHLHQEVPPYPSPPANSSYRRTGTLGRSITTAVRDEGGRVVGVIGVANTASYAPYVVSAKSQAWMHAGRWWTLDGVIEDNVGAIGEIISDEINNALGM